MQTFTSNVQPSKSLVRDGGPTAEDDPFDQRQPMEQREGRRRKFLLTARRCIPSPKRAVRSAEAHFGRFEFSYRTRSQNGRDMFFPGDDSTFTLAQDLVRILNGIPHRSLGHVADEKGTSYLPSLVARRD